MIDSERVSLKCQPTKCFSPISITPKVSIECHKMCKHSHQSERKVITNDGPQKSFGIRVQIDDIAIFEREKKVFQWKFLRITMERKIG